MIQNKNKKLVYKQSYMSLSIIRIVKGHDLINLNQLAHEMWYDLLIAFRCEVDVLAFTVNLPVDMKFHLSLSCHPFFLFFHI